jgi:ubiquitin-conjugating enzyme E2 D/E
MRGRANVINLDALGDKKYERLWHLCKRCLQILDPNPSKSFFLACMASSKEKAIKRLTSEYAKLCKEPIARCTAEPKSQSDFFSWKALLEGPPDTPYAGGKFILEFTFPHDYPFKPPQVKMITKCYHPNIRDTHICVDILQSAWSPALGITQVLLSLSSLLSDPNPASPLNSEAAQLFVKNRKVYDATVRDWVQKHASGPKASTSKSSAAAAAVPVAAAPVHIVSQPIAPLAPPPVIAAPQAAPSLTSNAVKRVRAQQPPLVRMMMLIGCRAHPSCRRAKLITFPPGLPPQQPPLHQLLLFSSLLHPRVIKLRHHQGQPKSSRSMTIEFMSGSSLL